MKQYFWAFILLVLAMARPGALALPATGLNQTIVGAADFGFSPGAPGVENTKALQRSVDQAGTIVVSKPPVRARGPRRGLGGNAHSTPRPGI